MRKYITPQKNKKPLINLKKLKPKNQGKFNHSSNQDLDFHYLQSDFLEPGELESEMRYTYETEARTARLPQRQSEVAIRSRSYESAEGASPISPGKMNNNDSSVLQTVTSQETTMKSNQIQEYLQKQRFNNSLKSPRENQVFLNSLVKKLRHEIVRRTKNLDTFESVPEMTSSRLFKKPQQRRSVQYDPNDSLLSEPAGPATFSRSKRELQKTTPISPGPSSYSPKPELLKRNMNTGSFYKEPKNTAATLGLKKLFNGCRQKVDPVPGPGSYFPRFKYTLRNSSRERDVR